MFVCLSCSLRAGSLSVCVIRASIPAAEPRFASRRAKRFGDKNEARKSEPARKPLNFELHSLQGDKSSLPMYQISNQYKRTKV